MGPKTIAGAALDWVLAAEGCHANATMRYRARKVDITAVPVLPAYARDYSPLHIARTFR